MKAWRWELEDLVEMAEETEAMRLQREVQALHTGWKRTGKFDLRIAFRAMDRDRDGYISVRDFGMATGGDSLLGEVSAAEGRRSYKHISFLLTSVVVHVCNYLSYDMYLLHFCD